MTLKLSEEQRQAIQNRDGGPIEIEDELTQRVYVLVGRDEFRHLVDEQLRAELQIGFDQADAGDVAEWDVEEILQEAHRRHFSDDDALTDELLASNPAFQALVAKSKASPRKPFSQEQGLAKG